MPVVDRLSELDPIAATLIVMVLTLAACYFVGRGRWQGFFALRHFMAYPPLWVAVVIGVGVLGLAELCLAGFASSAAIAGEIGWGVWFSLAAASVAILPLYIIARRQMRPCAASKQDAPVAKTPHSVRIEEMSFAALLAWLENDDPINRPTGDCFEHNKIAERMAKRLTQKDGVPTIALIGHLGAGKSTIGNLLAHCLRDRHDIRFVQMSLWPYDSAEAAVRGILHAVVDELGRHVNVISITGLPENYIEVVETASGRLAWVGRMLRRTSDPKAILKQFSDIAGAIGFRLVLWIEDLERFSGAEHLDGNRKAEREAERLGPIRALLYLLDQCPHISVVISDTSLRTRFDLGKIARYVERVPRLETAQVWAIVKQFRDRCLNGHPRDVIDPTAASVRRAFAPASSLFDVHRWLSRFHTRTTGGAVDAIAEVLRTPRALKSALRWTLELWETMPGEIDFDDVLVANSIKAAHPDLFAIIDDHRELFRYGFHDPTEHDEKVQNRHPLLERIERLLSSEDDNTGLELHRLLGHLSPAYAAARDGAKCYSEHIDESANVVTHPQALLSERHTDYWQRYLAEAEVSSEESDQGALDDIRVWRNQEASTLIDRLLDSRRGDQVAAFVNQFEHNDLCRLLREVAERLASNSAAEWEHQSHAPGIANIVLMMARKAPSKEDVYQTVSGIIKDYARVHLPLAHDVMYFFATATRAAPHVMLPDHEPQIRQQLRDALATHFGGDKAENQLAAALQGGSPYLIRWIAGTNKGLAAMPLTDKWPAFANTLLTLAASQPRIGIPQVAELVTDAKDDVDLLPDATGRETPTRWRRYSFNEEAATRFFADAYGSLLQVLADCTMSPEELSANEQVEASCRAAIDGARERHSGD